MTYITYMEHVFTNFQYPVTANNSSITGFCSVRLGFAQLFPGFCSKQSLFLRVAEIPCFVSIFNLFVYYFYYCLYNYDLYGAYQ